MKIKEGGKKKEIFNHNLLRVRNLLKVTRIGTLGILWHN